MKTPEFPDDHDPSRNPSTLQPPLHPAHNPNAEPGYLPGDRPDLNPAARHATATGAPPSGTAGAASAPVTELGPDDTSALAEPQAVPVPGQPQLNLVLEPHDEAPVEPYEEELAPEEKISSPVSAATHTKQG